MIQQTRFFMLLEAIDALTDWRDRAIRMHEQAQSMIAAGQDPKFALGVLSGFFIGAPHPLHPKTIETIAKERGHFANAAKKNDKLRQRRARRKDVERHEEYKAQVRAPKPWEGTNLPPLPPPAKLTHEQMVALNEAAGRMPMPQEPEHMRELRARIEELAKSVGKDSPKGYEIPDEEILGDVEGDEDLLG